MKNSKLPTQKKLFEHCRNATNIQGDTFVGIKFEINNEIREISVNFPLGYDIPNNEDDTREAILNLIEILTNYQDEESKIPKIESDQVLKTVNFPIFSYLAIIYDYFNRPGYYKENEEIYVKGNSGKINYSRTIKRETPIARKNGILYLDNQVRRRNSTDSAIITKISQYCVYESFLKIGWLYTISLPPKPTFENKNRSFQVIIQGMLNKTNKDKDRILLQSMLDVLNYKEQSNSAEDFYFGTNNFEYIWENLVDDVFGVKNKDYYFPHTYWRLDFNADIKNVALEPDTIMMFEKDIYILDGKYYKFGETKNPKHLPNSASINKQITYGEYIAKNEKFKTQREKGMKVYNAFIMPYNKKTKKFVDKEDMYFAIGEANAEWKQSKENYEKVQGILVDVRSLMSVKTKPSFLEMQNLSNKIVQYFEKTKQCGTDL